MFDFQVRSRTALESELRKLGQVVSEVWKRGSGPGTIMRLASCDITLDLFHANKIPARVTIVAGQTKVWFVRKRDGYSKSYVMLSDEKVGAQTELRLVWHQDVIVEAVVVRVRDLKRRGALAGTSSHSLSNKSVTFAQDS